MQTDDCADANVILNHSDTSQAADDENLNGAAEKKHNEPNAADQSMPQGPDDRAAPAHHATTLDTTVDNAESANGRFDSVARRERPAEQAVTAYYSGTAELMPLGAQVGPRRAGRRRRRRITIL